MQQAAEYIAYQTEQIEALSSELEVTQTKLATVTATAANSSVSETEKNELLEKLNQAAEYIAYQTEQMAELTATIETNKTQIAQLELCVSEKEDELMNYNNTEHEKVCVLFVCLVLLVLLS